MQQNDKSEQDKNEMSNQMTHVLLHNLDDVNSAIILFKIEEENVLNSILTFLKTKLRKGDFEFYNIFSDNIEMINIFNNQYKRIYFQEKKKEMKNKEELTKSIDVFTQREKYHQNPQEKYEKQNKQEGQTTSVQQLKQEQQQLDQQNHELQKEISQLKSQSQVYEQQLIIILLQIIILIQQQQLKNENILLQKELKEIKVKLQSQMQELNKERNDNKINPKIQIINQNSILEPKKEQLQSYYQNQNQQQNNYRNKCGHYIDISQIQNQVQQALRGNKIALCNSCQIPLQSKLCLLIQDYGKCYLETKTQVELKQLLLNLERGKLKNNEKLVKCQNNNCQFFCI